MYRPSVSGIGPRNQYYSFAIWQLLLFKIKKNTVKQLGNEGELPQPKQDNNKQSIKRENGLANNIYKYTQHKKNEK